MILPTAKAQPAKNPQVMWVNNAVGAYNYGLNGVREGRSFVRYIDFKCSSGLAIDIVNSLTSGTPLIQMWAYNYQSTTNPTGVKLPYGWSNQSGTALQPSVTGKFGVGQYSATGTIPTYFLSIDFNASGIGGDNNAATNDGTYVFMIDQFKDGTYSYRAKTFRLYGDVNASRVVDTTDYNQTLTPGIYGSNCPMCPENTNGQGQVYTKDVTVVLRQRGRTIAAAYNNIQI